MTSEAVQQYNRKKGRTEEVSTTDKYIDLDNLRVINKMLERQTANVNKVIAGHMKDIWAFLHEQKTEMQRGMMDKHHDFQAFYDQLQKLSQIVGELRGDK